MRVGIFSGDAAAVSLPDMIATVPDAPVMAGG